MDFLTIQESIKMKKKLLYFPPSGGRYRVFLTITNFRLIFSGEFDRLFTLSSDQKIIFKDGQQYIVIDREDISSIKINNSFLERNLVLSLNGKTHTFKKRASMNRNLFNAIKS